MITVKQAQAAMVRNKARIADLLKITAEDHSGYIYKWGLEFLQLYMGNDTDMVNKLSGSEVYWNWWRNHFNNIDEVFVNTYDGLEDQYGVKNMRVMYSYMHKPEMLVAELTIPPVVYGGKTFTHQLNVTHD